MPEGTARVTRAPRKLLRYTLYGLAVAVLVMGAIVAYLVATFEPLDHRQRIVDFVKEKTGRTLDIRGELELSFWPDLGIRLGALTLSERDSAEPFASIESARLRLELEPLLSREIVASEIVLNGASVRIVRFEDGRLNIDDLFRGKGEPPQFDIARVVVERSTLTYHDLGSGAQYALEDIALETGRLANGVPASVTFSARARDGRDAFDVKSAFQGRVTFDLAARRYTFERSRVAVSGRVPGIDDLALEVSASGDYDRAANALGLGAVAGKASGRYAANAIELAFDAASVEVRPGQATGEAVQVKANAKGAAGSTALELSANTMTRANDRIDSEALTMKVEADRGGYRVKAALAARLEAHLEARTLTFTAMSADFSASGARLPRKGLSGTVEGEVRLDLIKEDVQAQLAGRVDESQVKARVSAAGFASPVYTFAVTLSRLDLDRYFAAGRAKRPSRGPAAAGEALLAPLSDLPATGTLDIGVLEVGETRARNVRLVIR